MARNARTEANTVTGLFEAAVSAYRNIGTASTPHAANDARRKYADHANRYIDATGKSVAVTAREVVRAAHR